MPRVVLLARGATGWASLCRLISAAHLSGERSAARVTMPQVAEHSAGLVALLGPDSEVGWALRRRREDRGRSGAARAGGSRWAQAARWYRWHPTAAAPRRRPRRPQPLSSTGAARMLGWAQSRGAAQRC